MTDQQHPITPPDELVGQWIKEWRDLRPSFTTLEQWLTRKAARWGADQELGACCEWLRHDLDAYELVCLRAVYLDHNLRAARRPKPKSQAEEALKAIGVPTKIGEARVIEHHAHELVRAALERLRELEGSNA